MNDNPPGLESNAIEEENSMNGEHTVVSRDDECTMSCKGFRKHATIRVAMNKSMEGDMERTFVHETCGDPGMSRRLCRCSRSLPFKDTVMYAPPVSSAPRPGGAGGLVRK